MDVSRILSGLNEAQREAVAAPLGNQLVLAGAGSGKTRVLVHRIAWLIHTEQLSPQSILAVTFTNKAAREMRERIESLLGISTRHLWVGTFHGIAHRLLRTHWHAAGLPQAFNVLDADDQLRLVKRVHSELNLDEERWPAKQTRWFINAQKDEGRRPEHIEAAGDLFLTTMVEVYRAYEAACARTGLVDFAELLLRSHELWLRHPDLLHHYQGRFRHLLVDEFQDTNAVQYAWLRVLAGEVLSVTAVGDDDQSIYGWRGARIENIHRYCDDFAQVQTVRLEQNYRSTGTILGAANALIARNADRLGKELWTAGEEGTPISLFAGFNEQDEAGYVIERIEHHLNQGFQRSDIGVLYRSNAQSRVLEEALLRAAIPYRIYGGQRFYERLEIRNALAYLRLLVHRQDDAALERVINTPSRGVGAKTLESLRERARADGVPLWDAMHTCVTSGGLPARARSSLAAFIELIDDLQVSVQGLPLGTLVDVVLERSGLLAHHGAEKGEKGQARIDNLRELVSASRQFDTLLWADEEMRAEVEGSSPLAMFLDVAALEAGDAQAHEDEDSVQLMTLHSAKGLEFPVVFLTGVEEGLFPHKMSLEEPGRLEEERRLCYVGVTRAMQHLYLTYAEMRRLHGSDHFHKISRFVREIPPEFIQEVRMNHAVERPFTGADSLGGDAVYQLGQRVRHGTFGEGVILNAEGAGRQARVEVQFDAEGSKWLVLAYAKLQPI
ncbi:MAG: DNA helicase II [Pseudomonadota bacterium]|nr:DNA helicase II [Pseudomonadota bacterium]